MIIKTDTKAKSTLEIQLEECGDCPFCERDLIHPPSGPPVHYTTIEFADSGKVYDLGEGECDSLISHGLSSWSL